MLLLALLAGSATAFAPNASKNVITVDKDVSELKMHAMGEEAFMEKIDERTVYDKHDSIVFSYAGSDILPPLKEVGASCSMTLTSQA